MEHRPVVDSPQIRNLYQAILRLESLEECYRFFEDLCTVNEIQAMAQRLQVAIMLGKGTTYHEIVQASGASTATISRINRCLQYGAGGYRSALAKLQEEEKAPCR